MSRCVTCDTETYVSEAGRVTEIHGGFLHYGRCHLIEERDDLRAQLAAVTAERGDSDLAFRALEYRTKNLVASIRAVLADRDAAIARAEAAIARAEAAIARAEDAEAQTAYADETVRQTQEAMDAWRARAERSERRERVVEAVGRLIEANDNGMMRTDIAWRDVRIAYDAARKGGA